MIERDAEHLVMFGVYEGPVEFPDGYVVRAWRVCCHEGGHPLPEGSLLMLGAMTLEQARAALPIGLYRLDRSDGDDPSLVEVWL